MALHVLLDERDFVDDDVPLCPLHDVLDHVVLVIDR